MLTLHSIVRTVNATQLLLAVALALPACQETAQPLLGPVVCEVESSSNSCFRCQAQRCGAELDRCYGAGYHQGLAVSLIERCTFNADTNRFDGNCTYSGVARAAHDPCASQAACMQSCGCGRECARACEARPDGGMVTDHFSNDPRELLCTDCVKEHLAACVQRNCAAECPPT